MEHKKCQYSRKHLLQKTHGQETLCDLVRSSILVVVEVVVVVAGVVVVVVVVAVY